MTQFTQEQTEALAQYTQADQIRSVAIWKKDAPTWAKDLPDVKPSADSFEQVDNTLLQVGTAEDGDIVWDRVAGLYIATRTIRDSKGVIIARANQPIPWEDIREAGRVVITAAIDRTDNISQSLQLGNITLEEWQLLMIEEVKRVHGALAIVNRGGTQLLSQDDIQFIEARLLGQYGFLQEFANSIESGEFPTSGRRILRRSGLYALAAEGTGSQMRRRLVNFIYQVDMERRVLGFADHCSTAGGLEGCVELAAKGWQPVGTLPPIGESPCRTNCKCHFEFLTAGEEVVE